MNHLGPIAIILIACVSIAVGCWAQGLEERQAAKRRNKD